MKRFYLLSAICLTSISLSAQESTGEERTLSADRDVLQEYKTENYLQDIFKQIK